MDFIGKGDALKGYTGFAWIIAIAFVVLTGITVCNVKSADGTYYCKKNNDQLLVAIGIILTFNMAMQIINSVSTFYFIYVAGSKTIFFQYLLCLQVLLRILGYLFILKWYKSSLKYSLCCFLYYTSGRAGCTFGNRVYYTLKCAVYCGSRDFSEVWFRGFSLVLQQYCCQMFSRLWGI